MTQQIIELKCPNCGDTIDTGQKNCRYCKQPVVISTFNSVASMPLPVINKYTNTYKSALAANPSDSQLNMSIGFCYLKLKLYDKALVAFEKALEEDFDNSEAYFYASVSLLKGKKAFLTLRPEIDKIEEFLQAALSVEPKGIYYYLWAYIKYDYFFRKHFRTTPTYQEILASACEAGLSAFDSQQLFEILGVVRPDALQC